jgi:hypothetical protein
MKIPQLVAICFEGEWVFPKPRVASFPQPSCEDGQSFSIAEKIIILAAIQQHATIEDNHIEASTMMVTPTAQQDLFQARHTLLPSIRTIPLPLDAFNYTMAGEVRKNASGKAAVMAKS